VAEWFELLSDRFARLLLGTQSYWEYGYKRCVPYESSSSTLLACWRYLVDRVLREFASTSISPFVSSRAAHRKPQDIYLAELLIASKSANRCVAWYWWPIYPEWLKECS
jgi:hypothetical protein